MRWLLSLGCVVSLAAISVANAQPPARKIPEELRAAGEAALEYVRALPDPSLVLLSGQNRKLNNPVAWVREQIAKDRVAVTKAAEDVAALKMPLSKAKGFDVSFAMQRMRDDTKASIAAARRGLDALDAMIDAQKIGDCAAYAAQADILESASKEFQSFSTWRDLQAIEAFVVRFAGGQPSTPPRQVELLPPNNAVRMGQLADDLAITLRCPLPDAAFEIEVSISFLASARGGDPLFADVRVSSGLGPSQSAAIEDRFKNFIIPDTVRFANWKDAKQPFRFRWDGHELAPLIE